MNFKKKYQTKELSFIKESLTKNPFLKEIDFIGNNYKNKLETNIKDEDCENLNEILMESKNIEKIYLNCKILIK
jgi:hypothetical protein